MYQLVLVQGLLTCYHALTRFLPAGPTKSLWHITGNRGMDHGPSANYKEHFLKKSIFLLSRCTTIKQTGRCQPLFSWSSPRPRTQAALPSRQASQPQSCSSFDVVRHSHLALSFFPFPPPFPIKFEPLLIPFWIT